MFGIGQSIRRKPRQFNYNPRYYDAEQEARNQRRIELGHAPRPRESSRSVNPATSCVRAVSAVSRRPSETSPPASRATN